MQIYHFTFNADVTQALWNCIQHAPLPRHLTDALAAEFRSQVEAQNRANAEKSNGQEMPAVPS